MGFAAGYTINKGEVESLGCTVCLYAWTQALCCRVSFAIFC
ncbi:hypothetical protein ANAPRD1_00879 [Anaplasma phagocytophilum]|nr:hypothetical protein ANAPRD1_00879 [Anaplasma phagocytophilum]SCV66113.1 hypothetical protein ANAPH1_00967 [Anaplasma phagocytophilum]